MMMMMMIMMIIMIMILIMMMMSGTECDVYSAVAEYVTILTTPEVATCNAHTVSLAGEQKIKYLYQIQILAFNQKSSSILIL